ncbi:MAG: hypothetical protein EBZ58_10925, partial [Bacteroidetes bacterium]|nr:hypothetical protein [Bacteroidota bacterium]
LYAKYADNHPENFFDHWAKPVYTILAFPFTKLGFLGIKLFNILMSLISCYFGYKVLTKFNTKNSEYYAIILFSITLFVNVTLSGLTEPLSAAMLIGSIYLILNKKYVWGLSIISFLPFVRSEGLIILGVFFIYLTITKRLKFIPLLATGHLVMSIIGSFFYHDLLWVFNKIPYAHLASVYGNGKWLHFAEQLFFQMGIVEYSLLILGGVAMIISILKRETGSEFFYEKLWLVYGCFVSFFLAHSSFWALGIFNSMGLSRVFVFVMPLMAIIILDGLNFIEVLSSMWNKQMSTYIKNILIILILIFPFLNTPSSYKIPDDFELTSTQKTIKYKLVPYLNKYKKNKLVVLSDIDITYFYNLDPFDKKNCKMYYDIPDFNLVDSNEVVIWDNWFAPVEFNVPLEKLLENKSLKLDTSIIDKDNKGRNIQFVVFSRNKTL